MGERQPQWKKSSTGPGGNKKEKLHWLASQGQEGHPTEKKGASKKRESSSPQKKSEELGLRDEHAPRPLFLKKQEKSQGET